MRFPSYEERIIFDLQAKLRLAQAELENKTEIERELRAISKCKTKIIQMTSYPICEKKMTITFQFTKCWRKSKRN